MDFIWSIGKIALWILGGIVGLFIVIGVSMNVISAKTKSKSKKLIGSDNEKALEMLSIYYSKNRDDSNWVYKEGLIELAEKQNMTKAMVALCKYYDEEPHKNPDEKNKWKKRAAEAGDLESIMDLCGSLDYDANNTVYDEILKGLDKAKPSSDAEVSTVSYLRGLVCNNNGDIASAKKLFTSATDPIVANKSKYMLLQCFLKEKNLLEAERLLRELKDKDWPVSDGTIYKTLYEYYSTGCQGIEANPVKALKYACEYASSKGVDEKAANKLLAESYCNYAAACREGSHGIKMDINEAMKTYEVAAGLDSKEALTILGLALLSGELDGTLVNRDYYKGNNYLRRAACNKAQAKKCLDEYGVDGIIVAPTNPKAATYRFMGGYELTASVEIIRWLQLYYGIRYKANMTATAFTEEYSKQFNSFKTLMDGIYQLYADHVAVMLQWGINLLMSLGIDSYDGYEIINRCDDLGLLPRIPQFENGLDAIDDRATKLNLDISYAQATRGRWVGGGFGTTIGGTIAGSIKGSVAAGVMNAGSGILHGIGDSIVKTMNNSEINSMERKLFENPNTMNEFYHAVGSACNDIGSVVRGIIEEHSGIGPYGLVGEVIFHGENLGDVNDNALDAKINNNMSVGNFEYAYALLVEKLRRMPYSDSTLKQLFEVSAKTHKSTDDNNQAIDVLKRYNADFGLGQ